MPKSEYKCLECGHPFENGDFGAFDGFDGYRHHIIKPYSNEEASNSCFLRPIFLRGEPQTVEDAFVFYEGKIYSLAAVNELIIRGASLRKVANSHGNGHRLEGDLSELEAAHLRIVERNQAANSAKS